MRGRRDPQATMLAIVDLEERVPQDHPIRTIKIIADEALERLSPKTGSYRLVGRTTLPAPTAGARTSTSMPITRQCPSTAAIAASSSAQKPER